MTESSGKKEAKERFPSDYLQVLTHFYRGEVQRETEWQAGDLAEIYNLGIFAIHLL